MFRRIMPTIMSIIMLAGCLIACPVADATPLTGSPTVEQTTDTSGASTVVDSRGEETLDLLVVLAPVAGCVRSMGCATLFAARLDDDD